jgi:hypothetical protein
VRATASQLPNKVGINCSKESVTALTCFTQTVHLSPNQ